jgi:hypothetical protein
MTGRLTQSGWPSTFAELDTHNFGNGSRTTRPSSSRDPDTLERYAWRDCETRSLHAASSFARQRSTALWQLGPPAFRVAQKRLGFSNAALNTAAFRDVDLFWILLIRLL